MRKKISVSAHNPASSLSGQATAGYKQLQKALAEAEDRYNVLVDNIPDIVYSMNEQGAFTKLNKSVNAYGYTREELIGQSFLVIVHPEDRKEIADIYVAIIAKKKSTIRTQRFRMLAKSGEVRWFEANYSIRFQPDGDFMLQEGVARDITDVVENQIFMVKAREFLEEQVKKRTKELQEVNTALQKEIAERRETEKRLREREADLEIEKENMQQANTALKVLLKRREVDKRELEEQVLYNIKELVHPYLDKLAGLTNDDRLRAYLSIVQTNINDITCSFSRQLSLEFYNMTASEMRIANFIRQGKNSQDIAELLGLSLRTVEAYRQNIRDKLRIRNKKVNLRTFLLSIE